MAERPFGNFKEWPLKDLIEKERSFKLSAICVELNLRPKFNDAEKRKINATFGLERCYRVSQPSPRSWLLLLAFLRFTRSEAPFRLRFGLCGFGFVRRKPCTTF